MNEIFPQDESHLSDPYLASINNVSLKVYNGFSDDTLVVDNQVMTKKNTSVQGMVVELKNLEGVQSSSLQMSFSESGINIQEIDFIGFGRDERGRRTLLYTISFDMSSYIKTGYYDLNVCIEKSQHIVFKDFIAVMSDKDSVTATPLVTQVN